MSAINPNIFALRAQLNERLEETTAALVALDLVEKALRKPRLAEMPTTATPEPVQSTQIPSLAAILREIGDCQFAGKWVGSYSYEKAVEVLYPGRFHKGRVTSALHSMEFSGHFESRGFGVTRTWFRKVKAIR